MESKKFSEVVCFGPYGQKQQGLTDVALEQYSAQRRTFLSRVFARKQLKQEIAQKLVERARMYEWIRQGRHYDSVHLKISERKSIALRCMRRSVKIAKRTVPEPVHFPGFVKAPLSFKMCADQQCTTNIVVPNLVLKKNNNKNKNIISNKKRPRKDLIKKARVAAFFERKLLNKKEKFLKSLESHTIPEDLIERLAYVLDVLRDQRLGKLSRTLNPFFFLAHSAELAKALAPIKEELTKASEKHFEDPKEEINREERVVSDEEFDLENVCKFEHEMDDLRVDEDNSASFVAANTQINALPTQVLDIRPDNTLETKIRFSMSDYLTRWNHVGEFTWKNTADHDSAAIFSMSVYKDLLSKLADTTAVIPFSNCQFFRGDVELMFTLNTNQFTSGQLQISVVYGANKSVVSDHSLFSVYSLSQKPHVLLNAGGDQEVVLRIPFKYPFSMIRNSPLPAFGTANMATVVVKVMSQLRMKGSSTFSTQVFVSSRFTSFELSGMVDKNMVPKKDSEVDHEMLPIALNVASKLLAPQNTDLPPQKPSRISVQPIASNNMSAGSSVAVNSDILRLDPQCITPHSYSGNDFDFKTILSTYGLLSKIEINTAQANGKIIKKIEVTPLLDKGSYQKVTLPGEKDTDFEIYSLPPLAIMTSMYGYYRGSIEYRFDVVGTHFHACKLMVAFVPGPVKAAYENWDVTKFRNCHHQIYDILKEKTFSFVVPYVCDQVFYPRRSISSVGMSSFEPFGHLYVIVMSNLYTSDLISSNIDMLVYVRAGPDFELAIPAQTVLQPSYDRADSHKARYLQVDFLEGYYPAYQGTWHSFSSSNYYFPILRYGDVSDHVCQLTHSHKYAVYKLEYGREDVLPGWNMVTIEASSGGKNSVDNILYISPIFDGSYFYAVPFTTLQTASEFARLSALNNAWGNLAKYITVYRATPAAPMYKSSSTQCAAYDSKIGNLSFNFIKAYKGASIEHETNDQVSVNTVPTSIPTSVNSMARLHFGEDTMVLKDICRRMQLYCSIDIKTNMPFLTSSAIIPVTPWGVSLDDMSEDIMPTRSYLALICSGYLFMKGTLRFKIIAEGDCKFWVQHRYDSYNTDEQTTVISDPNTRNVGLASGYAIAIQDSSVNPVLDLEVPYYSPCNRIYANPTSGGLSDSQYLKQMFNLGCLVIGCSKPCKFTVFYALADDAEFSDFQGFPPVMYAIDSMNSEPVAVSKMMDEFEELNVDHEMDDVDKPGPSDKKSVKEVFKGLGSAITGKKKEKKALDPEEAELIRKIEEQNVAIRKKFASNNPIKVAKNVNETMHDLKNMANKVSDSMEECADVVIPRVTKLCDTITGFVSKLNVSSKIKSFFEKTKCFFLLIVSNIFHCCITRTFKHFMVALGSILASLTGFISSTVNSIVDVIRRILNFYRKGTPVMSEGEIKHEAASYKKERDRIFSEALEENLTEYPSRLDFVQPMSNYVKMVSSKLFDIKITDVDIINDLGKTIFNPDYSVFGRTMFKSFHEISSLKKLTVLGSTAYKWTRILLGKESFSAYSFLNLYYCLVAVLSSLKKEEKKFDDPDTYKHGALDVFWTICSKDLHRRTILMALPINQVFYFEHKYESGIHKKGSLNCGVFKDRIKNSTSIYNFYDLNMYQILDLFVEIEVDFPNLCSDRIRKLTDEVLAYYVEKFGSLGEGMNSESRERVDSVFLGKISKVLSRFNIDVKEHGKKVKILPFDHEIEDTTGLNLCIELVSLLITGASAAADISTNIDYKTKKMMAFEFCKKMPLYARGNINVISFLKTVWGLISKVFNLIKQKMFPEKKLVSELVNKFDDVREWVEEVDLLDHPDTWSKIKASTMYQMRVDKCASLGNNILCLVKMNEKYSSEHLFNNVITSYYRRITALKKKCHENKLLPSCCYEPFMIYTWGKPGIGKSIMKDAVLGTIIKNCNIRANGEYVYNVPLNQNFWTGCNDQPICYVDDFNLTTDENIALGLYTNIISMKSATTFVPNQAAVEDKGKPYNPEILYVCSNFEKPQISSTGDIGAFLRRPEIFVNVCLKDELVRKGRERYTDLTLKERGNKGEFEYLKFGLCERRGELKQDTKFNYVWYNYKDFMHIVLTKLMAYRVKEDIRMEDRLKVMLSASDADEMLVRATKFVRSDLRDLQNDVVKQILELEDCEEKDEDVEHIEQIAEVAATLSSTGPKEEVSTDIKDCVEELKKKTEVKEFVYDPNYEPKPLQDDEISVLEQAACEKLNRITPRQHTKLDIDKIPEFQSHIPPPNYVEAVIHSECAGEEYYTPEEMLLSQKLTEELLNVPTVSLDHETKFDVLDLHAVSRSDNFDVDELTIDGLIDLVAKIEKQKDVSNRRLKLMNSTSKDYIYFMLDTETSEFEVYRIKNVKTERMYASELVRLYEWNLDSIKKRYTSSADVPFIFKKRFIMEEKKYSALKIQFLDYVDSVKQGLDKLWLNVKKGFRKTVEFIIKYRWVFAIFGLVMTGLGIAYGVISPMDSVLPSSVAGATLGSCGPPTFRRPKTISKPDFGFDTTSIELKPEAILGSFDPTRKMVQKNRKAFRKGYNFYDHQISDSIAPDLLDRIARSTYWIILVDKRGNTLQSMRTFSMGGRTITFPLHYWECIDKYAGDDCDIFVVKDSLRINVRKDYFKMNMTNVGLTSLRNLELPPQFPATKNSSSYLFNGDSSNLPPECGFLVVTAPDKMNIFCSNFSIYSCRVPTTDKGSSICIVDGYKYGAHGSGFCGSIFVVNNKICGMHVAGGSGIGLAESLGSFMYAHEVCDVAIPDTYIDEKAETVEFTGNYVSLGTVKKQWSAYTPSETSFTLSPLASEISVDAYPATLSPFQQGEEVVSPLYSGVEEHMKPNKNFCPSDLAEASHSYMRVVLGRAKPVRCKVGVLTMEEACYGVPENKHYPPVDRTTSVGWPFVRMGSSVNTKTALLGTDPSTMSPFFRDYCKKFEFERARGLRTPTVFQDSLKDDLVPERKIRTPGGTRIISCCPIEYTVACRRYFGDFVAAMSAANFDTESAVGMNVLGSDWDRLSNHLQSFSPHIIDGDYKKFGPTLNSEVVHQCGKIINKWYEMYGTYVSENESRIRTVMIDELLNANHLVGRTLYKTVSGAPSGSPITVILNGMVNSIYIRLAYVHITGSLFNFNKMVRMITYGDDILIAIVREALASFNFLSIRDFFLKYDISFTPADKTNEGSLCSTIDEVSFLKSKFVFNKTYGKYFYALDLGSIYKMLKWLRRTKYHTLQETLILNLEACGVYLIGHGEDVYNDNVDRITSMVLRNTNFDLYCAEFNEAEYNLFKEIYGDENRKSPFFVDK